MAASALVCLQVLAEFQRGGAGACQTFAETREDGGEGIVTTLEDDMDLAVLWHPLALLGGQGQGVFFQQQNFMEKFRKHAGGDQPADAGPSDDGPFAKQA